MKVLQANNCQNCPALSRSAFSNLTTAEYKQIDEVRKVIEFSRHEKLAFSINEEQGFFCLRSGHWKLNLKNSDKEHAICISGPGDLVGFGDWYFDIHQESIETIESGQACFFSKKNYDSFLKHHPAIMEGFVRVLCRLHAIKERRILGLSNTSVKSRVAAVLLNLNEKFGLTDGWGSKINVELDRKTIAELCATVPETLSRILTELEEDGFIQRRQKAIYIQKKEDLRKLATS